MKDEHHRVLVTGGAGFIGSELVRQLAPRCGQVVVVDNLVNGRRENLEGAGRGHVELIVADIRDTRRMADVLAGADVVFHLACLGVRHSIHSPHENHEVNATATLNLLSLCREAQVGRFVCVSTSEVYGTGLRAPMTEEHPAFPMTVYGAAKLAGEGYARAFYRTYGYPTVVVRPFNTYGPRSHHEGDCGEVIPKFLLRGMAGRPVVCFGDGTQTRDFTYVSDTAAGILMAGVADQAIGETINLGTGLEITINDLARHVVEVAGLTQAEIVYEPPRPGDTLRLCADITRARKLLGFSPRVELADGLKELRQWYLSLAQTPEQLLQQECVRNWDPAAVGSGND